MKKKIALVFALAIVFMCLWLGYSVITTNTSTVSKQYSSNVKNVITICNDYSNGDITKIEATAKIKSIYDMMKGDTSKNSSDNQVFLKVSSILTELSKNNSDISQITEYIEELKTIK